MEQLSIFDFMEKPKVKQVYGTLIIKFIKNGWELWFRDFMTYSLQPTDKLKDLTDVFCFREGEMGEGYIHYGFQDICVKQYGHYQRHLNEFDYTKRDEVFEVIIERLGLKVTLGELLEMTIEEFRKELDE